MISLPAKSAPRPRPQRQRRPAPLYPRERRSSDRHRMNPRAAPLLQHVPSSSAISPRLRGSFLHQQVPFTDHRSPGTLPFLNTPSAKSNVPPRPTPVARECAGTPRSAARNRTGSRQTDSGPARRASAADTAAPLPSSTIPARSGHLPNLPHGIRGAPCIGAAAQ
jgi:hypothetical protein